MSAPLATKQQSLKIFEKLKTKPANKVRNTVNTDQNRVTKRAVAL